MASLMRGWVTGFFTYETTKSVVVKSWSVGIINRVVQLLIITYFVGWVFIHEKAYQVTDTGVESSVMTKVKGFGKYNDLVMDVADYIYPPQGTDVFCIMTRIIITENQFRGRCPEARKDFQCSTDADCHKHLGSVRANGIITGACIDISESKGRCEIEAWCPAENDKVKNTPMANVENFTIFIKNSIRFPLFNVTRGNFLSMSEKQIKTCTYHPELNPFCPIFRVGDVLSYTNHTVDGLAEQGGEIGINIEWKCNLDRNIENCVPRYSFTRMDATFTSSPSKGYNFRFAKYFKTENGTEFRTLHKAYAIRFDVMVTGNAGKFSTIPTLINLVAAFTSIGLGTVLCDIILLNFLKGADQYKAKKFEEVSDAQIEASITPSPDSQSSLKPGE
ncbi:P2X purinoceptor 3a isoform X2 [Cololabis saira]|uniref:P2X purinoceptor 3a isoform X2 n=1 Tax=Cololabis saira TaxID=129043 RepID=UPI002AD54B00|nr:P2X purinoceptor 3a isoform X2 [Cololabis saira]